MGTRFHDQDEMPQADAEDFFAFSDREENENINVNIRESQYYGGQNFGGNKK